MHHTHHDPIFVVLSIVVAVLGSWTALDLFRRATQNNGRARTGWLATASVAMGISIWSMHFIAMLGFDPGSAVSYDPALTAVSLLLAVISTAGAFFFVARANANRHHVFAAGAAMGAGICAMHYVGMAALETAVSLGYDVRLVALSLAIAVAASTAALLVASGERSAASQAAASVILGLAIVGMHYTALAALKLTLISGAPTAPYGAPPIALAVSVAALTILLLFLAIMASLFDQRDDILSALEAGGVGFWELDLRTKALRISPQGKAIYGLSAESALSYEQALSRISPESRVERERQLAHAIETETDYDIVYLLASGDRWVNVRGRAVKSRNGTAARMVGVVLDVTDRRNAFAELETSERRQRLLIDELNHRVKNTLATVQSISRQTARHAPSLERFHADFEARLMALSATHNVLTRSGWERVSLREILVNEMKPYADGRVDLIGEDFDLPSRIALALGMVFHELATNAARHGGLSVPEGRLNVTWSLQEVGGRQSLEFRWTETGRPIMEPPARKGFGSRLVISSIEGELGGRAIMDFDRLGLRCLMIVPME
jgi:PAS domain S-box-containing protein